MRPFASAAGSQPCAVIRRIWDQHGFPSTHDLQHYNQAPRRIPSVHS